MYPALVTLSLILVFGSSAYMSVSGLLYIFPNSPWIIISMGLGMEIGKILTISHLYRNWEKYRSMMRLCYIIIIAVLTFLTSFEVMGFLSQCYQDSTQGQQIFYSQIDALNKEEAILKSQIETIDKTLEGLPASYVSIRIKERKNSSYDKIKGRLVEIVKEKGLLKEKQISDTKNMSPVFALSAVFEIKDSDIISIFIPLLVLILEPLAIGLTIATNSAWLGYKQSSFEKSPPKKIENLTQELQRLQKEYNLSVDLIAKITNRKN